MKNNYSAEPGSAVVGLCDYNDGNDRGDLTHGARMPPSPPKDAPRLSHEVYANAWGYFWLPCPRCGREFGGHEKHGDSVQCEHSLNVSHTTCCVSSDSIPQKVGGIPGIAREPDVCKRVHARQSRP